MYMREYAIHFWKMDLFVCLVDKDVFVGHEDAINEPSVMQKS